MKTGNRSYIIGCCLLILLLALFGCDDFFEVENASDVDLEDIITVKADDSKILADGFSHTTIRASLPNDAVGKEVIFSTNFGTLRSVESPESDSANRTIHVKAAGGTAFVLLRSDLNVTEAIISASVDNFTNFTTVQFTRAYPDAILLSAEPPKVKADNTSKAIIEATLISSNGSVSKNTLVNFSVKNKNNTDQNDETVEPLGKITENALSGTNGKVQVNLFSGDKIGVVVVTATVNKTTDNKENDDEAEDNKENKITASIEVEFVQP